MNKKTISWILLTLCIIAACLTRVHAQETNVYVSGQAGVIHSNVAWHVKAGITNEETNRTIFLGWGEVPTGDTLHGKKMNFFAEYGKRFFVGELVYLHPFAGVATSGVYLGGEVAIGFHNAERLSLSLYYKQKQFGLSFILQLQTP